MSSTKTQWRIQVRAKRGAPWKNKGLYETREHARAIQWAMRECECSDEPGSPFGFGNTRVVRYQKGGKK